MMPQSTLEMAKDLVMAQVQAGALPPEDMYRELQRTYSCLAELKAKEEIGESSPVVSGPVGEDMVTESKGGEIPTHWKKSVKKYVIVCMVCGSAFKQLSVRHLKEHGLEARSYRVKFGIPRTQPLSAKDTTAVRKRIVQQSRPWEKAPTYIKAKERKTAPASGARTGRTKKQPAND